MSLTIRKAGMLTTVQDLGRYGSRSLGVNPGGVMDRASTRALNAVLGNHDSAALLEMHFPAPEIEFEIRTFFAVGGAEFGAELDANPVRNYTALTAEEGSVLKFAHRSSGQRAYLAVRGGLRVPAWLGSSSTNLAAAIGGHAGRRLSAGDRLDCIESAGLAMFSIGESMQPRCGPAQTIRIVAASEFELMTAISERSFTHEEFKLTNDCNRMGYRLEGEPLHLLHAYELISAGVTFGTIQLLPDGQLIVLMADHQTSGGYPRIGNVVSTDLAILAQCGPGDSIRFEMVSVEEAETLAMNFEKELNYLRVGCRLQGLNANR
jgi:antagonist of KipI